MHLRHDRFTAINARVVLPVALLLACFTTPAFAQLDRIYPVTGATITGSITGVTPNGISIKSGGSVQEVASDQIKKVLFEGDPAPLTNGREFAIDGQYDQALAQLETLDLSTIKREIVLADAIYYRVLAQSELALAGKGDQKAAAAAALAFAGKYRDSWHFYDVAKLLGDLALALGNYDSAVKYYGSLRNAPSAETKIKSVYFTGLAYLSQGDTAKAIVEFDKVAGLNVQSVEAARMKKLATAGKAMSLSRSGKHQEGIELVKGLIADLNPSDTELAARVYNAQGASYEAAGDVEGAIMAYLHTHLMFSADASVHAEALSKLVELWPKIGKPERSTEARQELQQRYPGLAG